MPRGAYTAKQERKADHIEKSYEKRGVSKKEAEERAWRTVNKQDKGGKNDGSGRSSSRSAAAKKGWETRRRTARLSSQAALEDFDRALDRAQFAVREPLEFRAAPVRGAMPALAALRSAAAPAGGGCPGPACARPGRREPVRRPTRLTAGAPRSTGPAIWLSVAGSLARDRRQQLAPRPGRRARPGLSTTQLLRDAA